MGTTLYVISAEENDLRSILQSPDYSKRFELIRAPGADLLAVNLGKTWHALGLTLSRLKRGNKDPGAFLLEGDGDGGDRIVDAERTSLLATQLSTIDEAAFRGIFDPEFLEASDAYPELWDEEPEDLLREHLECFQELTKVVLGAAERGWPLATF